MRDYDVRELKTAEQLDAAFAKTFGMASCNWAQALDQDAVTDFLEGKTGDRRIWRWTITCRNWGAESGRFEAIVSSINDRGGVTSGHKAYGFSAYACHAIMKAAIGWDQRRRYRRRVKDYERREKQPADN